MEAAIARFTLAQVAEAQALQLQAEGGGAGAGGRGEEGEGLSGAVKQLVDEAIELLEEGIAAFNDAMERKRRKRRTRGDEGEGDGGGGEMDALEHAMLQLSALYDTVGR